MDRALRDHTYMLFSQNVAIDYLDIYKEGGGGDKKVNLHSFCHSFLAYYFPRYNMIIYLVSQILFKYKGPHIYN